MIKFIFPFALILPGFWILTLTKVRLDSIIERLSLSYILSLAIVFSLLYLGGIMNAFNVACFVVLAIMCVSFIHLLLFTTKVLRSPNLFSFFSRISVEKLVVFVSSIGLLSIYIMFLSSRAILDSDVVQYYLPMAREIVRENRFTYSTGYDYNVLLKPIGASVLYAWTYVVSGSTLSEDFRLMPLVPILVLIVLNYKIAVLATKSQTVGIISTAVFLILPFHDRLFLLSAFYPDRFYYPLILAALYFLLKYFQSKRSSSLFWMGVGLGAAILLKAQTIYFLIAFMLVFAVLELKGFRKLSAALCTFTPFYILAPSILVDSIQRKGFLLSIPSFTGTQLELFLFLSMLSGVCYFITTCRNVSRTKIDSPMITGLVKKITFLLLPFAVLSSLWYVNNLLRFGTLISTSSIDLPNYDWARGVLKPMKTQPTADIWHYIPHFMFMFVDPAVMGYVMLIPLIIGLAFVLRNMNKNFNALFLYGTISASIILSTVAISLPSATPSYNPRDILPLAPLLTTLSAIGIVSTTSNFRKKGNDPKNTFTSLLLVAYFGLLSYIHSVLVWFTSSHNVTIIGALTSALGYSVGLNLRQTSFHLSYADRAIFVGENILRIVALSLVAGIPVLALMICRHYKLFTRGYTTVVKLVMRRKKTLLESRPARALACVSVKSFFVISLMLSIIIIPRVEMLMVQGGPQEIKENQLKRYYGNIYELFASPSEFEGDILTFKAPMGLPYYLPSVKIIDLTYPANLAFLKDCLLSGSPYETVVKLRQQGINYLLVNPSITQELDASLNFTISKMMRDPELAILSKSLGSWKLYTLGPYNVEKTFIPLSDWSVDLRYTNASYVLNSTESSLYLELDATNMSSRVTIRHLDVPKLNLSDYDYIVVNVQGSGNARVLMRFFLDDGSSFDVAYWIEPYTLFSVPFDLRSYFENTLRGDAYIGLKSSDEMFSSINILEISFVNVKG